VAGADIVTTVTADKRRAVIVHPDMIEAGMHINAVGGDCPGKTELHRGVLEKARVVVEFAPQSRIEGEVQQMPPDFAVTELWEVLAGKATGRRDAHEVTVFDSVGFALEDFSALRYLDDHIGAHQAQQIDLVPALDNPKDLVGRPSPSFPTRSRQTHEQDQDDGRPHRRGRQPPWRLHGPGRPARGRTAAQPAAAWLGSDRWRTWAVRPIRSSRRCRGCGTWSRWCSGTRPSSMRYRAAWPRAKSRCSWAATMPWQSVRLPPWRVTAAPGQGPARAVAGCPCRCQHQPIHPTGNIHGMPVACLLGVGPDALTRMGGQTPAMQPQQICQIGIRSVDREEKRHLRELACASSTCATSTNTACAPPCRRRWPAWGRIPTCTSFDVDFLDAALAPVGTAVLGGPTYREAQLCMEMIADTGRLASLDVMELNPACDVRNQTAEWWWTWSKVCSGNPH
jgi:hypothetical protein